MEKAMKNFFLYLSKNKSLIRLAKKHGLKFGASRFVAGETIQSAVEKIRELNLNGLEVTLDYLGEFVDTKEEADFMADNCITAIEAIGEHQLRSQVSLKLTSMGMDISKDVVMDNMRRILEAAKRNNVFVTIDMEDYSRCQKTLDIFQNLRKEYDNIGTVIQAYLYRSEQDIDQLNHLHPKLRFVKGAYKESDEVAFPEKKDVDENYKKLVSKHLSNGNYTAIATHDEEMIDFAKNFVTENWISKDQFEFQMLYGIRSERQQELANEGYKMRVYVPYGTDWYGYFMRRLAERPANVAFVAKGMFKK